MSSFQQQTTPTPSQRQRRRLRPTARIINAALLSLLIQPSHAFFSPPAIRPTPSTNPSKSSLNVWFFGGSESQTTDTGDSCELVAVRIERTSSNSRRISGEITVEKPLSDVWAILTDYDNLSTHVPNLVESRRVRGYSGPGNQGDGGYTCRLYQKGAQKIVGFQFGADVTMKMQEAVMESGDVITKKIDFECVDSLFFSNFDGEWKITSNVVDGADFTTVSYVVDVRPKGPVPVVALEWRIREDVPTNLRAVKTAAIEVGEEGVMAMNKRSVSPVLKALPPKPTSNGVTAAANGSAVVRGKNGVTTSEDKNGTSTTKDRVERLKALANRARDSISVPAATSSEPLPVAVPVEWNSDETMGAYLRD